METKSKKHYVKTKITKIAISGCCGKMGQIIINDIKKRPNCNVVAGIDVISKKEKNFNIFDNINDLNCTTDVIIDFSNPAALNSLLAYCVKNKMPIVLCTTGYSKEQIENIKKASSEIPIFYSGNMSLGINLLIELSKQATKILGNDFDIEIIEKHHNQKLDAPSGTALMIADSISNTLDKKVKYIYDRHKDRKEREKSEIGIHSIRGGTIVGEHEVLFAGKDEILTISHSATSKEIFATGAINAAIFLKNQNPGIYNMGDLLNKS